MKVISIVGARPQFIKLAPIAWAAPNFCEHQIIHTGQHYDPLLTDVFFSELKIPKPIENLNVGSGSHSMQTGLMLIALERVLNRYKPDKVLIYGDTNSTVAGALCASKMNITVGHVEAGLRSYNKSMPEEINRVISDHVSSLLFAPTKVAMRNLHKEGLTSKSLFVGDLMYELLERLKPELTDEQQGEKIQRIFCTIHRAENTDSRKRLSYLIETLSKSKLPVDLFAHPRLLAKSIEYGIKLDKGNVRVFKPISYFETIKRMNSYAGVITDSGGLQKEAFFLSVPCLTIRNETEWPETLAGNWNQIDPKLEELNSQWYNLPSKKRSIVGFGNGQTSNLILRALF